MSDNQPPYTEKRVLIPVAVTEVLDLVETHNLVELELFDRVDGKEIPAGARSAEIRKNHPFARIRVRKPNYIRLTFAGISHKTVVVRRADFEKYLKDVNFQLQQELKG